jgi:hypothetical protein
MPIDSSMFQRAGKASAVDEHEKKEKQKEQFSSLKAGAFSGLTLISLRHHVVFLYNRQKRGSV